MSHHCRERIALRAVKEQFYLRYGPLAYLSAFSLISQINPTKWAPKGWRAAWRKSYQVSAGLLRRPAAGAVTARHMRGCACFFAAMF